MITVLESSKIESGLKLYMLLSSYSVFSTLVDDPLSPPSSHHSALTPLLLITPSHYIPSLLPSLPLTTPGPPITRLNASCHTPEYHIGIDLIKPCQNPVRMRYSGVWHSGDNPNQFNKLPNEVKFSVV